MELKKKIEELYRGHVSALEKCIEDALESHFGISIDDVDLREIEHIVVMGDPIESYRYRGETFLYVQFPKDIDVINTDPQGVKLALTFKYKEV